MHGGQGGDQGVGDYPFNMRHRSPPSGFFTKTVEDSFKLDNRLPWIMRKADPRLLRGVLHRGGDEDDDDLQPANRLRRTKRASRLASASSPRQAHGFSSGAHIAGTKQLADMNIIRGTRSDLLRP